MISTDAVNPLEPSSHEANSRSRARRFGSAEKASTCGRQLRGLAASVRMALMLSLARWKWRVRTRFRVGSLDPPP